MGEYSKRILLCSSYLPAQYDDIVKYEDFDEYKVAKAFYKTGDIEQTTKYLAISLEKWTSKHAICVVSQLRSTNREYGEIDDQEIKANADGFIKMVKCDFTAILEDERIRALLSKAYDIVGSKL